MKIIFMGTPDFSVSTLEALIQAGHEIVLAVTQPDKPKGRGKAVQFPPVKQAALAHQIEVYQPKRVREPECAAYLRKCAPDLIVTAAFGRILPEEILDIPKYGCINVHASLLPKYRGAAPIQWAIINGDKTTGITIMQMDAGMDTGDIIRQAEIPIAEDETGGSLFEKLAEAGGKLCVEAVSEIENGTVSRRKQEEGGASHVGMITKEMGNICWQKPAAEIERLVRGLNPWPSAYTRLGGKTLKIWKAAVIQGGDPADAGRIITADKKQLIVQTAEGRLSLLEVQLEGKKRMPADAFLRGYQAAEGQLLGEKA